MRKNHAALITCVAALVCLRPPPVPAAEVLSQPAALILSIDGGPWVIRSNRVERELRAPQAVYQPIFPNEVFRATGSGKLGLLLPGAEEKTFQNREWQKLPAPQRNSADLFGMAYDALERVGGIRGAATSGILSPCNGGSVRPGQLVVLWLTNAFEGDLMIEVADASLDILWNSSEQGLNVPNTGQFASGHLSNALREVETVAGASRSLYLTIRDSKGHLLQAKFELLSPNEAKGLERSLQRIERSKLPFILKRIASAKEMTRLHLFNEADGELRSALVYSGANPSPAVLRCAAELAETIGDKERAKQLRAQASSISGGQ